MTDRPRIVQLRGHNANVWDLRPLEALSDTYDLEVLVTGANLHRLDGLGMRQVPTATPRDRLPGRVAGPAAYALGERYLGLEDRLRGAAVVHAAEIGSWFAAQAAALKPALGFKLVLTVWETLPWLDALRWPRERRYRRAALPAADLFLAATERARNALLLEGAPADRIRVAPPGIDLDRFAAAAPDASGAAPGVHTILVPARLVWEKGQQEVLRAVTALRRGLVGPPREDLRVLLLGDGPEAARLRKHAADLGIADIVELRSTVPYDEMPALHRAASCMVLDSLPTKGWEEQFGMVLVEAMAAGTPVIAGDSGAIAEVLDGNGTAVRPGDWHALAVALRDGPLSRPPGTRAPVDAAYLDRFSGSAAGERYRAAYAEVLTA